MEKKLKFKEFKSPSELNSKINISKYSHYTKTNNLSKTKISQRKNKSELKLKTNYERFLPFLGIESYNISHVNKFKTLNEKKNSIINKGFYNSKSSEELQKTLSFNKNRMIKNKTELNELKIQYNKLSEDNEKNRKLLSKILHLNENKQYSKEELLEKMKTCEFDNISKQKMLNSIKLINLKLEVNEKKCILKSKNNELNLLKENSKYKNISDLKRNLISKEEAKNKIILEIEKLKEILLKDKEIMKQSEEENKKLD